MIAFVFGVIALDIQAHHNLRSANGISGQVVSRALVVLGATIVLTHPWFRAGYHDSCGCDICNTSCGVQTVAFVHVKYVYRVFAELES